MRTILLHVHPDGQQDARVQCALDLARIFGAHITCLQVLSFQQFVGADPLGGVYVFGEVLAALREQQNAEMERISARLRTDGASFDWLQADGDIARTLVIQSSLADLTILSQTDPARGDHIGSPSYIGHVSTKALGPIIALPSTGKRFSPTGTALVAWNGSVECAHALRLSLPFLKSAAAVRVVEVGDVATLATDCAALGYLGRHDVKADFITQKPEGGSTGNAILAAADRLGADFIVMGAFGHARLMETILGGVTYDLTAGCPYPLLLAH